MPNFSARINMGGDRTKLSYDLKTMPRPKGKATSVIVTEYDLPRQGAEPHDAIVDAKGIIWYDDFGQSVLGRLNPKTGETKEWPMPIIKQGVPQVPCAWRWIRTATLDCPAVSGGNQLVRSQDREVQRLAGAAGIQ